jgi:hypothetical protein
MSKNEYIIHGTQYKNLIHILKDSFIDNEPIKKYRTMLKVSPKLIFTQLIYPDIPNETKQNPHWLQCCIVLKKELLKDYSFFVTPVGGFDADEKKIILKGDGNLSKIPSIVKLKKYINKTLETSSTDFMHSHEILFDKKIPLDKYCKCIIMYDYNLIDKKEKAQKLEIIELANKLNISVITRKFSMRNKGINNFIEVVNLKS